MVQKCSLLKVLEVFFVETSAIHFIKEVSKRIKLAHTSTRKHIKMLLEENLIKIKKSKPFNGFIANRENEKFIFYKRVYNLYSLEELKNFLVSHYYPNLLVVFGSYSLGEDVENSDIDILIISKAKKELELKRFEEKLERRIHLITTGDIKKLDKNLQKKVMNGIVLYGSF